MLQKKQGSLYKEFHGSREVKADGNRSVVKWPQLNSVGSTRM